MNTNTKLLDSFEQLITSPERATFITFYSDLFESRSKTRQAFYKDNLNLIDACLPFIQEKPEGRGRERLRQDASFKASLILYDFLKFDIIKFEDLKKKLDPIEKINNQSRQTVSLLYSTYYLFTEDFTAFSKIYILHTPFFAYVIFF